MGGALQSEQDKVSLPLGNDIILERLHPNDPSLDPGNAVLYVDGALHESPGFSV